MKLWMRKISVILITFMTLGVYIPPTYLNVNAEESAEAVSSDVDVSVPVGVASKEEDSIEADSEERDFIGLLTEQAKKQTHMKLGPRIMNQVEEDFTTTIQPNMEDVLTKLLEKVRKDSPFLAITEEPSQGYGEKIFTIYDYQTKKDIARFDVRRVKRPLEGYWFNFHYHINSDNFQEHHEIGEIYWDKNSPPKWMS